MRPANRSQVIAVTGKAGQALGQRDWNADGSTASA